ncbi:MAG TPA: hypothetical protein VF952_13360 [Chloroflexia bacterium]
MASEVYCIASQYISVFLNSLPEATVKHGLTANLPGAVADWLR